ncbi:MAG: response regulator [bacterium]|nr:response regulator [bacterium]
MTNKLKILVVDSVPESLAATSLILQSAGHIVLNASIGGVAWLMIQEYRPDLILIDLVLPDTDGREICKRVKTDPGLSGTYVMLISTLNASSDHQPDSLCRGADGVIVRPISNRELLARVHAMGRLRDAEIALRNAKEEAEKANLTKSRFMSNISQELRTPVHGIMKSAEIVLETDLSGKQKKYLQMIQSSASSLLMAINEILDFSKFEPGKMTYKPVAFDLKKTVMEILEPFKTGEPTEHVKLNTHFHFYSKNMVEGDPDKLRQVLVNLMNNAVKFTPGGEINIDISLDREKDTHQIDDHLPVRFSISDTGIGIPEDKQETIFDAFTQVDVAWNRQFGGAGLGLTISRELVEVMGGVMGVESQLGKGSTFYFTLSFRKSTIPIKKSTSHHEISGSKQRKTQQIDDKIVKILIAEDDLINRVIMDEIMTTRGWKSHSVENGHRVLEVLEEVIAKNQAPFHLILMDVHMPQMDGIETTKVIRKMKEKTIAEIPIIACTAYALEDDYQELLNAGADDVIPKPFKTQDLYKMMEKYLPLLLESE